jgi:hypothetical protein
MYSSHFSIGRLATICRSPLSARELALPFVDQCAASLRFLASGQPHSAPPFQL